MDALSDVLLDRSDPLAGASIEDLRQLGYAASLVKGSVPDEKGRLRELIKSCAAAVGSSPSSGVNPRDPVQGSWGALWPLDARKLRLELPLHVLRKSRDAVQPTSR